MAQYLAALPAVRRAALSTVRKAINKNLPDGYEEGMQFGTIGWYVPLSVYPAGYGENPKVPQSPDRDAGFPRPIRKELGGLLTPDAGTWALTSKTFGIVHTRNAEARERITSAFVTLCKV